MHKFSDLKIWQKGRSLVKDVYLLTGKFPKDETFALTSQIRRASVLIPSNITEGCGRNSNAELARFLDIANGSSFELETQLLLAADLEYVSVKEIENLINDLHEIEKMIYNLKLKLN
jgi:four helix bundle protein